MTGLLRKGKALDCNARREVAMPMDDEETRRKPTAHEVGMIIDAMSVEELRARIGLLEAEIARLTAAIEAREKTRSAADLLFKR
jgi:uncharacterized small protein (DUF1192 family)